MGRRPRRTRPQQGRARSRRRKRGASPPPGESRTGPAGRRALRPSPRGGGGGPRECCRIVFGGRVRVSARKVLLTSVLQCMRAYWLLFNRSKGALWWFYGPALDVLRLFFGCSLDALRLFFGCSLDALTPEGGITPCGGRGCRTAQVAHAGQLGAQPGRSVR